jgi:hypothetical protein
MSQGKIEDGQLARTFALAGGARLTLVSVKTGVRFTYRVTCKRNAEGAIDSPHFVALLTGADNNSDYSFLGTIFDSQAYKHGRKSRVSPDAPSAKGFAWAWSFISKGELPPACEVWHEGRCGKCGRALTDPESIKTGLGPVCAEGGGF